MRLPFNVAVCVESPRCERYGSRGFLPVRQRLLRQQFYAHEATHIREYAECARAHADCYVALRNICWHFMYVLARTVRACARIALSDRRCRKHYGGCCSCVSVFLYLRSCVCVFGGGGDAALAGAAELSFCRQLTRVRS